MNACTRLRMPVIDIDAAILLYDCQYVGSSRCSYPLDRAEYGTTACSGNVCFGRRDSGLSEVFCW